MNGIAGAQQKNFSLLLLGMFLDSVLLRYVVASLDDFAKDTAIYSYAPARKLSTNLYDIYHC